MEIIYKTLTDWQPAKDRESRFAELSDGRVEDLIICDAETKETLVVQKQVDLASMTDVKKLLLDLRLRGFYNKPRNGSRARASGILAYEQWFGFVPPDELKRRFAINRSSLYSKNADLGFMLENLTPKLWEILKKIVPNETENHENLVRKWIHNDWLLCDTPFTSGIINHTNVLPYHKDSGNLPDSWSMMLALREGDSGGHLHIPEFQETLAIPNCSITFFNGQKYWHGVTPVRLRDKKSYRFTMVWYVKNRIKDCGSQKEELNRAKLSATKSSNSMTLKRQQYKTKSDELQ